MLRSLRFLISVDLVKVSYHLIMKGCIDSSMVNYTSHQMGQEVCGALKEGEEEGERERTNRYESPSLL